MTTKIFLDANFFLVPAQFGVDIYSAFEDLVPKPFEIILLSAIFTELEAKMSYEFQKTKLKREFHLARQILEKKSFRLLQVERSYPQLVDDLLLNTALEYVNDQDKVFIATNDKELRRKCSAKGIFVIFLRQQKYLAVE